MKKLLTGIIMLSGIGALAQQTPTLLKDVMPGSSGSSPYILSNWNNNLYFTADDGVNGYRLWKYNGTGQPALIPGLTGVPTPTYGGPTYNKHSAIFNNKMYFQGADATSGAELFAYDGVNAPNLVADIKSGGSSFPDCFATLNGVLYFVATSPSNGRELYSYDGTNPPVLHDVAPGAGSGNPDNLTAYNGKLYFLGDMTPGTTYLLVYDPASNTTTQAPGITTPPHNMHVFGGKMYFTGSSSQLCSYDGNTVTQLTSNILNGVYQVGRYAPLVFFNNQLYFNVRNPSSQSQLARYDTSSGNVSFITPLYSDIVGGTIPGNEIIDMIVYKSALYFSGSVDSAKGTELYKYDGSTVSNISDLSPGAASSTPTQLNIFNGGLYMTANDGSTGDEVYSLGNPSGVQSLSFDGHITVYPNPASTVTTMNITLGTPQLLQISITDLNGRQLFTKALTQYNTGANFVSLPIQQFAAGQYFYTLADNSGRKLANGSIVRQ